MNKKILLGSIIAVIILVLVSFTGIVGYQTTKSNSGKVSPLFNMRIKRAIVEESKDIACDYVGMGEETNIRLTSRMKRAEQVQKTINIISKMGDKSFSKMVTRIILNLKNQEQMTDIETSDVLQALHYIRENPNVMGYYDEENSPPTVLILSCIDTLKYTCFGRPFCIIKAIYNIYDWTWIAILGHITSLISCYHIPSAGCCDAL